MIKARVLGLAVAMLSGWGMLVADMPDAQAQSSRYRYMSCDELWYARNEIYANKGYCFKTARARSVFGRGCFPPYGRLTSREQNRVADIERWEYRKGCR